MLTVQKILSLIATLGPIGYIPFAPGTFGTIIAFFSIWLFPLSVKNNIIMITAGLVIGSIASTVAERRLKEKDSPKIIIDEYVGFYAAAFLVPHTFSMLLSAFIIFRFFDIFKPLMIKKIEKTSKKGFGVMVDDLVAGIYTNIVIQAYLFLMGIMK